MKMLSRRELLAGALAAPALLAKNKIDHSRISAISDEIARSPEDAIAFAHQYGLKWLELRDIPGHKGETYFLAEEDFLKEAARQFTDGGVGISFLNTNLLKFGLPGTEPVRRTPEAAEAREKRLARESVRFEQREQDLRKCIRSAQILGCRYVRVFTFSRVAEPETVFPRAAEVIDAFARIADAEGVQLLVENETSCNVAKCSELAAFLKLVPSRAVGINWDVMNGQSMKETPLPDGFSLLPANRIHNVQIKGRTILDYPEKLDWAAIFNTLDQADYKDKVGLETHIFGEIQVAKSHESMRGHPEDRRSGLSAAKLGFHAQPPVTHVHRNRNRHCRHRLGNHAVRNQGRAPQSDRHGAEGPNARHRRQELHRPGGFQGQQRVQPELRGPGRDGDRHHRRWKRSGRRFRSRGRTSIACSTTTRYWGRSITRP